MNGKLILTMLFVLLLILAAIDLPDVPSKSLQEQLQELYNAKDRDSLRWHIRKAKIVGDKEVTLSGLHKCPPDIQSLDDALNDLSVILAKPVERVVETDEMIGLITWYKFKVIDDLSSIRVTKRDTQGCSTCNHSSNESDHFPASLLPLEADEILVFHVGGDLIADGIRVNQPSTILFDFSTGSKTDNALNKKDLSQVPEENLSHEYLSNTEPFLLFLSLPKASRVGALVLLERGIYSYSSEAGFKAVDASDGYNPIKIQLESLKLNSLEKLNAYTQQMK